MKNIDYVIKKVSKEQDLNEETVSSIYKFYWKKGVFDKLRLFDDTAISLPKIGTFYLSYFKLRQEIL